MKEKSYIALLSRLLAALPLVFASVALAQNEDTTDENDQTQEEAQQEEEEAAGIVLQEVTVTGSRIMRPGVDTVYPAVVIGEQELENAAYFNVAQALNSLPSFSASGVNPLGLQGSSFTVGMNFVNYLGLGAQRTLTLVNGRRFVTSNPPTIFGAAGGLQVDLNVIPLPLVKRIEVIGIGGAPVYGSDAIAGTVNVILKKHYQGLEVGALYGITQEGDGENNKFYMVTGANFSNGRGNITMSVTTAHQDKLPRLARPFYFVNDPVYGNFGGEYHIRRGLSIQIVTFGGLISSIPFVAPSLGIGAMPNGKFYEFAPNGNLVVYTPGNVWPGAPVLRAYGGDVGDFFSRVGAIRTPQDRQIFTSSMRYDFSDNIHGFANFLYANTNSTDITNQASFQTGFFSGASGALRFSSDYLLLNDQASSLLQSLGVEFFYLNRISLDIEDPRSFIETDVWRFVGGFKGEFEIGDHDFNWEVYGLRGESDVSTQSEDLIDARFLNAIDVMKLTKEDLLRISDNLKAAKKAILKFSGTDSADPGTIICEAVYQAALGNADYASGHGVTDDDLPFIKGCVPLNLFGFGAPSAAATAWVTAVEKSDSQLKQTVYHVDFGGELLQLPGGPVTFNVGYEQREEKGFFNPGALMTITLGRDSPIKPTGGGYTVDSFFGELRVPLFSPDMDIPLLHSASFYAAARQLDNSLFQDTSNVWTVGLTWSPVRDITFRGNYTESVRTPAIVELFSPRTEVFSFAEDPCDKNNVHEGPVPDVREANCRADLGPDYDPDEFVSQITDATRTGTSGGNPNLDPETAEAYSIGFTFEPRWVDNLTMTLDYLNIELSKAITTVSLTTIMQACYDSRDFPNVPACDKFRRNDEGQVVDFQIGYQNAAKRAVEAVKVDILYNFAIADALGLVNEDWGAMDLGYLSTDWRVFYLVNREFSVVGEPSDAPINGFGMPEWSGTTSFNWRWHNWNVYYRVYWQESSRIDPNFDTAEQYFDLDGNVVTETDAYFLHHVTIGYNLSRFFPGGPRNTTISLNIDNLFYDEPSVVRQALGHYTFADILGRTYTLRLQASW